MSLLLRLYDVDEGEILINDINIKDIKINSVREKIGYVGQEPVLFDLTIDENIALGNIN